MQYVLAFLGWTLMIYVMHVAMHYVPVLKDIHWDHHKYITDNDGTKWSWNNLLLYNDTWLSTADLWITEVIPTLVFCWITGHWWIALFYYVWAAFVQEQVEHNKKVNLYPLLTTGRWHLVHHKHPNKNYGLFLPIWDKLFGTDYKGDQHGVKA